MKSVHIPHTHKQKREQYIFAVVFESWAHLHRFNFPFHLLVKSIWQEGRTTSSYFKLFVSLKSIISLLESLVFFMFFITSVNMENNLDLKEEVLCSLAEITLIVFHP